MRAKSFGWVLVPTLVALWVGNAWGATFTSQGDGNWNSPATWTVSGGDSDGIPDADDLVIVQAAHTVTLTANGSSDRLSVNGTLRIQTFLLTVDSATSPLLTGTGTITTSATGLLRVDSNSDETLVNSNLTVGNLELDGSGGNDDFTIANGVTFSVNGDITVSDGNLLVGSGGAASTLIVTGDVAISDTIDMVSSNSVLQVGGNWTQSGIFDAGTNSTVVFLGNAAQTVNISQGTAGNRDFEFVRVTNPGGVTIANVAGGTWQIDEDLTLDSGGWAILDESASVEHLILGANGQPGGRITVNAGTTLNVREASDAQGVPAIRVFSDSTIDGTGTIQRSAGNRVSLGMTSAATQDAMLTLNNNLDVRWLDVDNPARTLTISSANSSRLGYQSATSWFLRGTLDFDLDVLVVASTGSNLNLTSGTGAVGSQTIVVETGTTWDTQGGSLTVASTNGGQQTFEVNGTIASTGGTVTAGNTGRIGGSGVIGEDVVVASGGTLAPGNPAQTGILTADSADLAGAGRTFLIKHQNFWSPGSNHDQLRVDSLNLDANTSIEVDATGLDWNQVLDGIIIRIALYTTRTGGSIPSGVTYLANPPPGSVTVTLVADDAVGELQLRIAAPTPATVTCFEARADGAGILLHWHCAGEYQNLGFRLERRALGGAAGEWAPVHRRLIRGRLTAHEPKEYVHFDEPPSGSYEYRLFHVDTRGQAVQVERLAQATVKECLAPFSAQGRVARSERKEAARLEDEHEKTLSHFRQFRRARAATMDASHLDARAHAGSRIEIHRAPLALDLLAATRFLPDRPTRPRDREPFVLPVEAVKVVYEKPGVLSIPAAELPGGFDPRRVTVSRGGRETPVLSAGEEGLRLYAPGYEDRYTKRDVFFLFRRASATKLVPEAPPARGLFGPRPKPIPFETGPSTAGELGPGIHPAQASSPAAETSELFTVTERYKDIYFHWIAKPLTWPPWISEKWLWADASAGEVHDFAMFLPGAEEAPAVLRVEAWSYTDTPHRLMAAVNGTPVGQADWVGGGFAATLSFHVPPGVLREGQNTVTLATPVLSGVDKHFAFLQALSLTYRRGLEASAGLKFQARKGVLYEARGLPSAQVWVLDLRDAGWPAPIAHQTRARGDSFAVRFLAPADGAVLIWPKQLSAEPEEVRLRTIHKHRGPVAYLATGPARMGEALQPLLEARAAEGLRPLFVDQETLFDAYGFGRYGPEGIRLAVRDLRPAYLLLAGRSIWDYHNNEGRNLDPLCPTFLVPTSRFSEAPADALFGDLGRGVPEVSVGRIPVNTPEELAVAVSRTLAYRGGRSDSGQFGLLVAGRRDPRTAVDFAAQAEALAAATPERFWYKAYLGVTHATAESVGAESQAQASGGVDVIAYAGHGTSSLWSDGGETILNVPQTAQWTGNVVLLQATCTANYFIHSLPGHLTIAQNLLTQPQGGAAASIATTTYMDSPSAVAFMQEVLRRAAGKDARWGRALLAAQQWAAGEAAHAGSSNSWGRSMRDLANTECLLGDPALRVYVDEDHDGE